MKIPIKNIFKLIADLIRLSKDGISKEEAEILLGDLAEIALAVAKGAEYTTSN